MDHSRLACSDGNLEAADLVTERSVDTTTPALFALVTMEIRTARGSANALLTLLRKTKYASVHRREDKRAMVKSPLGEPPVAV